MDIPVESWFDAIKLRHSQRKYSGEMPKEQLITKLEKVVTEFKPFGGSRSVFVSNPADDVFKGIIGSYFKVTNAPCYIAFVSDRNEPNVQAITGYLGEGIILEATALGLNTCWVGGFFKPEVVRQQIELEEHECVLGITPIGYSESENDRVGVSSKQHKRKDLNKLVQNEEMIEDNWVRTALEAARLAPSAANRQPWLFRIGEDSIIISIESDRRGFGVSKKLDCGIAMLHIELGAQISGVTGTWSFLPSPEVGKFEAVKIQ